MIIFQIQRKNKLKYFQNKNFELNIVEEKQTYFSSIITPLTSN